MKLIKKLAFAIAAVMTLTVGSLVASSTPSMAAGAIQVPAISAEAATTAAQPVHYRSYYHRHGYKRRARWRRVCNWVKQRYWDQYDYVYRYKRVKVCKRVRY